MFGKEKSKSQPLAGSMSTISTGTNLQGDINSDNDMRIDGYIKGNIHCRAKVVLSESAIIDGDLEAANADVFGTVNGNVTTTELLCLKSGCVINGDISVGRLDIEANALFNGKCNMVIPQKQQPATFQPINNYEEPRKDETKKEEPKAVPPVEVKKPVLVIGEEEVGAVQSTLL